MFSELQKMIWDCNIMKVSKVQNLLIRLYAQFNTGSFPTNTMRTWMSTKESPWSWVQAGGTIGRAWYHLSLCWHVHEE